MSILTGPKSGLAPIDPNFTSRNGPLPLVYTLAVGLFAFIVLFLLKQGWLAWLALLVAFLVGVAWSLVIVRRERKLVKENRRAWLEERDLEVGEQYYDKFFGKRRVNVNPNEWTFVVFRGHAGVGRLTEVDGHIAVELRIPGAARMIL